jgi:hypothetical protein
MKKISSSLLVVLILSLSNVASASGGESETNIKEFDSQIDMRNSKFDAESSVKNYTFFGEEILGTTLVRTYLQEGEIDRTYYSIEIPKEIMDEVNKEKNDVDKINKIYEKLSRLYIQNDSWLKLNVLANQTNDRYKMTNIKIDEDYKNETSKKIAIILKEMKNREKTTEVYISDKENHIDNEISKLTYDYLSFNNFENSIKVLSEKEKELKENNLFIYFAIGMIILIIVLMLVRKKIKKGG